MSTETVLWRLRDERKHVHYCDIVLIVLLYLLGKNGMKLCCQNCSGPMAVSQVWNVLGSNHRLAMQYMYSLIK